MKSLTRVVLYNGMSRGRMGDYGDVLLENALYNQLHVIVMDRKKDKATKIMLNMYYIESSNS